jgi:RNA polymerase sigma-70 factor (ECF subfamily)
MQDDALQPLLAAGTGAWPDLALGREAFRAFLVERVEAGEPPDVAHAADLFLACACAHGVAGAATAFEKRYRETIERAVARADRTAVDEGTQVVLIALLVPTPDAPPRIAGYRGRSALRTWVAAVAANTTRKLRRRIDDRSHDSIGSLPDAVLADEPELALARARHGPDLAAAIRETLASLEPREVVLLRLHHAKGWSLDQLAALYDVGRSSVGRWVLAAREKLLDGARDRLRARLTLTPSELESLVVVLRSDIQVSLVRLLDEAAPSIGATGSSGGRAP